jgi:questin oxidase-like protein
MDTDDGVLDEAWDRLHHTGPEFEGWLTNHAPMAVEALTRHGQASAVHGWLDRYRDRLEDAPRPYERVTAAGWHEALGDARRLADWTDFFTREVTDRPWRELLAEWWPRLLPGISGAATHPVIRVGHAVRTLLTDGESGPRRVELAHALGYWAARHAVLPPHRSTPAPASAAGALEAVPAVVQDGGIRDRLARITELPAWPAAPAPDPETARAALRELVAAATRRYATHAHGSPVMLVHAATAPNAVLRTLPALPRPLWEPSVRAAWAASAAVTAAYTPTEPVRAPAANGLSPQEAFARATAHGDAHAVKFADTALDVGDAAAVAATVRAVQLIEPME